MKRITKKQAAAFCKAAAALFDKLGFQPAKSPGGALNSRSIMTDLGRFIAYQPDPELEAGSFCVDINGRFPDTSPFDKWRSPERAHAAALGVSFPSGKWNVLHSDPDTVLAVWEHRMNLVNARPPTPAEAAAWAEQDRKDEERWAKLREALIPTTTNPEEP